MTEDTQRAIEIIKPLADELHISIEADKGNLYLDRYDVKTTIGISCNSTYATIMEFIGFILLDEYSKRFRDIDLSPDQKAKISRYMKE